MSECTTSASSGECVPSRREAHKEDLAKIPENTLSPLAKFTDASSVMAKCYVLASSSFVLPKK